MSWEEENASCFFGRGPGPLCSVLIPSRGAPAGLGECVRSCVDNALDPSRVEFLVRLDDDDPATDPAARKLSEELSPRGVVLRRVVGGRGRGYFDLHNYLNDLAGQARGDWLLVLNDDCVILTEHWDEWLRKAVVGGCWHPCPQDVMLLWCTAVSPGGKETPADFFLLRRKTYEILGSMGKSPFADAWLRQVLSPLECAADFPAIRVRHDRDPLRPERADWSFIPHSHGNATLASVGACMGKLSDAMKVLAHVEGVEAALPWSGTPPPSGWCRWRAGPEGTPVHAAVGEGGSALLFGRQNRAEHPLEELAAAGGLWQRRAP